MGIKQKIKKIIGSQQWINPIYDDVIYKINMKSFSGNSLSYSNVLLVFDTLLECNKVKIKEDIETTENCNVFSVDLDEIDNLDETSKYVIGNYNHIINYLEIREAEDVYKVYSILQKEAEYLIGAGKYNSTICTVIVTNNKKSGQVLAVKGLLEGLAWVLSNHEILSNGIITDGSLTFSEITQATLFMSSKYGQLLMSNVIEMGAEL